MNQYYKMMLLSGGETSDSNAPVNTVAPAISGTLVVGNVLSCSTGTWTSDTGLIPPYTYQWYRGVSAISGETNNTYTLVQADAGQNIKCRVTACDSDGCANADSNSVYIIDAEAQAHYDRVIADGGTIPLGLNALNSVVVSVKNTYGVESINDAMWACKPHWGVSGIKTASGIGLTAGGMATSVLYDICGVDGDFIQTTASAQPLALVHSGTNYIWSVQYADNYISSTTTYATSDVDIEFSVNMNGTAPTQRVVSLNSNGNPFSILFNGSTNIITVEYYVGGYKTITCNTSLSGQNTFRISRNATTGGITILKNGVTQTISGTQSAGSLDSLPTSLFIGNMASVSHGFQGVINWVKFYIGGTLVREMNPASYNRATSQTSWVSATGETWTLNTPSTDSSLKSAIVDQTMIMGNGINYAMCAPSLNINDTAITSYTVFKKYVNYLISNGQVVNEFGTDSIYIGSGRALLINYSANCEGISISADVGCYLSLFTSTSLSLKVVTGINNIANANESNPYLVDNTSQSFASSPFSANNTTALNAAGYNFLARDNGASEIANVIVTGDIVAKGENDNTQRTEMYNLLKTLNNI